MAYATYPRKGTISMGNFKLLLESDSVFNQLSDAQQTSLVDTSVQRIAALRNSLSLSDYNFDTVGNADIDIDTLGFTKFVRYAIIDAGTTYEGTLYASNTILVEQGPTGFSGAITDSRNVDVVTFSRTGEFTNAILWDVYGANVIVTRTNDDTIEVDVSEAESVVIIEIFKR
jgi:hypothetical protein